MGGLTLTHGAAQAQSGPPDLPPLLEIIDTGFDAPLQRYDGRRGVWSTLPRRGQLMTNAQQSVMLDRGVLGAEADAALPELHTITEEGLALRSVVLPEAVLPALRDYMRATQQGDRADQVRYASALITTQETWSQAYGWFEVEARIPRGKGRWPAFWMTFAGEGWPPEIDVFEAYGAGITQSTRRDGQFQTGVFFDAIDAEGEPTHDTEIENPFGGDGAHERVPLSRQMGGREVLQLVRYHDDDALGANIYDAFHTYAALWTPEEIVFYFGPDRDSLREVFRTPTPDDLHDPMYVIANDQFTARGGWWQPSEEEVGPALAEGNDFVLRNMRVAALVPPVSLDPATGFDPRSSVIEDTPGDDVIAPGEGFDVIRLSQGADLLRLSRGREGKVIEGFGADDRVELEGYPIADAQEALSRLTQVGDDAWLPSGADPGWPQTLIFRDTQIGDLTAEQFDVRWSVGPDLWADDARRPNRVVTKPDAQGVMRAGPDGGWIGDADVARRMVGGPGPDRFHIGNAASRIEETADGGADTLITWANIDLPDHVERGVQRGQGKRLRGGPGDDRLEAMASHAVLDDGPGSDLFVIDPKARGVVVAIRPGAGDDRLRGMGPSHRIGIERELRDRSRDWRIVAQPEGSLVDFGGQTLLVEGLDPAALKAALGMD